MKMFRSLTALVAVIAIYALMAGCAQVQAKIDTDLSKFTTKVQTVTNTDINNALVGAAALPAPANADVTACLTQVQTYIATVVTAFAPPPPPPVVAGAPVFNPTQIGAATGLVDFLSIGDNPVVLPAVPKPPHTLIAACAVARADAEVEAQALLAKFGLDAATVADLAKNPAALQALLPIKP